MEEVIKQPVLDVIIKDEPMDSYEIYEYEIVKVKEEVEVIESALEMKIKLEKEEAAINIDDPSDVGSSILSEHNYARLPTKNEIQTDEDGIEYEEVDLYEDEKRKSDENRKLKCPQCPTIVDDMFQLNYHLRLHEQTEFECRYCSKRFKRKITLKNHHCVKFRSLDNFGYQVQRLEPVFKCRYCDKSFIREILLKEHQQHHEKPNQFYCASCDKKFRSKYCLANHNKIIHSEKRVQELKEQQERMRLGIHREGWIKCQVCPLLFKSIGSRNKHCDQAHGYSVRRRIPNFDLQWSNQHRVATNDITS